MGEKAPGLFLFEMVVGNWSSRSPKGCRIFPAGDVISNEERILSLSIAVEVAA